MLYFAYLDEFGHIGPYISRKDPVHNTSPVFGFGGIILPYTKVRGFATWFYQLKSRLLAFEISESKIHPAKWEKKGSALYTIKNLEQYRELRVATNRMINKIVKSDGFIFYYGREKIKKVEKQSPEAFYCHMINESIKRINAFCLPTNSYCYILLDEIDNGLRKRGVERAGKTMFGDDNCKQLVEPPVQVESHLYQTIQCADWICGILGRLFNYEVCPAEFPESLLVKKLFSERIARAQKNSKFKKQQI